MDADREKRALQFGDPSLAPERPAPVVRREPERTAPAKPEPAAPPLSKEERLRALLSEEGFAGIDLQGLDLDSIVSAIQGLREAETSGGGEDLHAARERIDLLERRLAKLTHLLGVTEEELQRVASMKGIDLGIASIYRSVQGLSEEAANREKKIEMMKTIFQANLELRKHLSPGKDRPEGGAQGLAS
jgi:hypothetical protein